MIMGMTNRIRDRTIAPPLVPGSRKTGRLLFSDMFSAVVVDLFVLMLSLFCRKALLLLAAVVNGETLLLLALIADGAKADACWSEIMAAIAHAQRVNIDLAMIKIMVV